MTQPAIIFHHPLPICEEGATGSEIRPYRMLRAFRELGYEVDVVAGRAAERQRAMAQVRARMAEGKRYAFLYAESATMPTPLAEPHHLPLHPVMDLAFFRWVRQQGVPIGLFYRDVYWRFPQYQESVVWWKRWPAVAFYWADWLGYRQWVDHLFLPSTRMGEALPTPWPPERLSALPPGCDPQDVVDAQAGRNPADNTVRLFYVGGVTPPYYDLRPMLEAVAALPGVSLTLCCREGEWRVVAALYRPFLRDTVRVIHAKGRALEPLYGQADAFLVFRSRHPYLDFALPVKVFEALGYGVPIITVAGTEAGRFVEQEGVGWAVDGKEALVRLIERLRDNPVELARMRQAVQAARWRHTWVARAQEAARVLEGRLR